MSGPKKQYPIQLAIRLSDKDAAKLDKLRGDKTRSQWIRDMIREIGQKQARDRQIR